MSTDDTEAAAVWERLAAKASWRMLPTYLRVLGWCDGSTGWTPGRPGVGAGQSRWQRTANLLARHGLIALGARAEWPATRGRYVLTDLGRRVAAHGRKAGGS